MENLLDLVCRTQRDSSRAVFRRRMVRLSTAKQEGRMLTTTLDAVIGNWQ
jgi:hypothetical protein